MAKNIYDLFNERKNGVDYLVEGFEYNEEVEAFEDLFEAAENLYDITAESTNEMIEFEAACYLEDLVLENMMYEDFDEEKLAGVMEAAKEEKKTGLGQKIKNLWQKIKEWFARAFKTIINFFQSGETLVAKYRKQIPQAMHQSKAKIKIRSFKKPEEAMSDVEALINRLKDKYNAGSKEQVLSAAGVKDSKGIKGRVEEFFYNSKEAKEQPINGLNPDVVMNWAGNKKVFVSALKVEQKNIDAEFKEILNSLKESDNEKDGERVKNFQFAMGLANSALSAQMGCIQNLAKACTAIVRKALAGKYDPKGADRATAADTADRKQEMEDNKKYAAKVGQKMADKITSKKLHEEWEILDEEENNDDINW
jgi:hypothetical protein